MSKFSVMQHYDTVQIYFKTFNKQCFLPGFDEVDIIYKKANL